MAAALPSSARVTVALVYLDPDMARRFRIRQKLEERGLVVKKECAADSKRFDFATVDAVVAIRDGLKATHILALESACEASGSTFVRLAYNAADPSWRALDPLTGANVVQIPTDEAENDTDPAAWAKLCEEEAEAQRARADQSEAEMKRVARERDAARADRERLSKENETLRGRVTRLETDLSSARDALGEKQSQGDVVRDLQRKCDEQKKGLLLLRDERDQARAERNDAREELVSLKAAKEALANAYRADEEKRRVEVAVAPKSGAIEVLQALRVVAKSGVMGWEEAFDKAVESCR